MDKRFIVIIWHQAGGQNENKTYYTWQDENENTNVFDSEKAANDAWNDSHLSRIHAGFVVECTTKKVVWM